MDRWKAVIAPNPDVLLESYALFKEWLVLEERSQGLTRLRQVNWQSGEQKRSPSTIRPMSPGSPTTRSRIPARCAMVTPP